VNWLDEEVVIDEDAEEGRVDGGGAPHQTALAITAVRKIMDASGRVRPISRIHAASATSATSIVAYRRMRPRIDRLGPLDVCSSFNGAPPFAV